MRYFFALLLAALSIGAEILPLQKDWINNGATLTNNQFTLPAKKGNSLRQQIAPALKPFITYSAHASVGLSGDALLTNAASLFLSLQTYDTDGKLIRTLGIKEILVGREQLTTNKLTEFSASFTTKQIPPRGTLHLSIAVAEPGKGDWLISDIRAEANPAPTDLVAKLQPLPAKKSSSKIQYNRDIRPILSENCFACHGPDSAARKADLRLDRFADATKSAVVPGNPDKSDVLARIITTDEDDLMPPPKTKKTLTAKQKDLIRQWIADGAEYELHWAFQAPVKPELPAVQNSKWPRTKIDNFILERLEKSNLTPAPEADARTLARRAALDLTGLPPTPDMVAAFLKDKSPKAYENYVDRLLASKAYGEHRARYWLDAARYADTHGIHFDNYREMWTYREWVINAFNKNQPFDKFTIEQLAGDLLPNPTIEQQIASGLNRCNITSNEGGLIDEEYYVLYMKDRTETASTIFMGLTTQCAGCHDHKFDPLSQKEYYSLAAFFNNSTVGSRDGNKKDPAPVIVVPTEKDRDRWFALEKEMPPAKKRVADRREAARPDFDKWLPNADPEAFAKAVPKQNLILSASLASAFEDLTYFIANGKPISAPIPTNSAWTAGHINSNSFQSVKNAYLKLGDFGDFEKINAWSYGAWVRPEDKEGAGAILARMDEKNDFRGYDLYLDKDRPVAHIVNKWPDNAIRVASKTRLEPKKWSHVFVTYDGSSKPSGLRIYVNGKLTEVDSDNKTLTATVKSTAPFTIGHRHNGGALDKVGIQDVRLYNTSLAAEEVAAIARNTRAIWLASQEKRTDAENNELYPAWLNVLDAPYMKEAATLAALEKEDRDIRARGSIAHIMQEKSEEAAAYLLHRGEYDRRRERIMAGTPEILPPLADELPRNRLGLAQWLVDPKHPLTARVTVNRFWQELFGVGLVRSAGDFGISGELPSHPELLDHLAVEFIESGWDMKKLFKTMVMSATYRQSAATTPEKLKRDPQNTLLSRGPRFRMDAEMVRDYALAASGLLVEKIGGPSVKPYQPEGVWEIVAMPESDTKRYMQDHGENLYRRSLYTFWKRAAPPASMDIFNAPSRETCTVKRDRTNTPLQALVTLNDTQFIEAARHLAERAILEGGRSSKSRLNFMAENLLARPLRAEELRVTESVLEDLLETYRNNPAEAEALISVGDSKPNERVSKTELAGYTMAANQLMNLDEVLTK